MADLANERHSGLLTLEQVRTLTAEDLGMSANDRTPVVEPATSTRNSSIESGDPILAQTRQLLDDGFAGVILTGPPGTSKTYYAEQLALKLTNNNASLTRFVQFHPSYQYEDFVEGYAPNPDGGFDSVDKHLLEMCNIAEENPDSPCVLVIDELSRSDPGRVFGEGLTYIEMTKREQLFSLSSGRVASIPKNLVFIATMNPLDRGVDEVDVAFDRRFAKIDMQPDSAMLRSFLDENGMEPALADRVVRFFDILRHHENPYCRIGHAYFRSVKDRAGLERLWTYQLQFVLKKATRLDVSLFERLRDEWLRNVIEEVPQPPPV